MKKRKKVVLRWLLIGMVLLFLTGFWGETVKAIPVAGESYHVVMMHPENEKLNIEYYLRDVRRSSSTESGTIKMMQPFFLYALPRNVENFEASKPFWKEENRLYCVEGTGRPKFITKGVERSDGNVTYTANARVIQEVNKTFGATKEDWILTGHVLSYNRYAAVKPRLNQVFVYLGLKQTTETDRAYMPSKATESLASISDKNRGMHGTFTDWNLAVDMFSEARLMEKRIATVVTEKQKTKTITEPGSYRFDSIAGYAIPGMTAKAVSADLVLPETLMKPMRREALLADDSGYVLSFTVPKTAKNGTYTISVKRPDFSVIPKWTGFSSDTDVQKSAQWCASVDDTLPMKEDRFVVKLAMGKEYDPSSEASETSTTPVSSENSTSSIMPTSSAAPASSATPVSSEAPTSSASPVSSAAPASSAIPASSEAPTSSAAPTSSEKTVSSSTPTSSSSSISTSSPNSSVLTVPSTVEPKKSEEPPLEESTTSSSTSSCDRIPPTQGKTENPPTKNIGEESKVIKGVGSVSPSITLHEEGTGGSGNVISAPPIAGDTLRLFLWGTVAVVAGVGLIVMEVIRRRDER